MQPQDVGWPSSQMVLGRLAAARRSGSACVRWATGWKRTGDLVFEQFKTLCEKQRVIGDADAATLMQDADQRWLPAYR